METTKDKTKAMRNKVKVLLAEFDVLNQEVLAQINSTSDMQITDPTDRLRFYLLDEVITGFSRVTSGLHRLWDTYPATPKMTPASWCYKTGVEVLDPDGWRQQAPYWEEAITWDMFLSRFNESTVRIVDKEKYALHQHLFA